MNNKKKKMLKILAIIIGTPLLCIFVLGIFVLVSYIKDESMKDIKISKWDTKLDIVREVIKEENDHGGFSMNTRVYLTDNDNYRFFLFDSDFLYYVSTYEEATFTHASEQYLMIGYPGGSSSGNYVVHIYKLTDKNYIENLDDGKGWEIKCGLPKYENDALYFPTGDCEYGPIEYDMRVNINNMSTEQIENEFNNN